MKEIFYVNDWPDHRSHWNSEVKLPKTGILLLGWVTLLTLDFLAHLTTYCPPNHSGDIRLNWIFSPTMWKPRGLSLREIRCGLSCLCLFKVFNFEGGSSLWWPLYIL